jgi:PUA domain protein
MASPFSLGAMGDYLRSGFRYYLTTMSRLVARKRHTIRKSQVTDLLSRLNAQIGDSANQFRGERVEIVETDTAITIYLVEKKPVLMEREGLVFPTLQGLLEHPFSQRKVVVDSGAVPFVVKGADVMRPGITSISDDILAGMPVQVVEERHGKPIATGIALFDAEEMRARTSGKVIKTYHFVGDEIWGLEL